MKNLFSLFALVLASSLFAQKPITSIPFELYGDHILIDVSVDNSTPLKFIFDSGSGLTVLDSDVSQNLKLSGKKIKMNEATNQWFPNGKKCKNICHRFRPS